MKELIVLVPAAFVGLVIVLWLWRTVLTVRADELVWWSIRGGRQNDGILLAFRDGRRFYLSATYQPTWINVESGASISELGWLKRLDSIASLRNTPGFAELERPWEGKPGPGVKSEDAVKAAVEKAQETAKAVRAQAESVQQVVERINRLCICGHTDTAHGAGTGSCCNCPPEAACKHFVRQPMNRTRAY